jgi:predicted ribosome quality control (RQC) complex YloA/Tae2 family protein
MRLTSELNEVLNAFRISKIYSQEKNKLMFELYRNHEQCFVELSVDPGLPYITLKKEFHRAKKNTIDFFNEAIGKTISAIEIALYDRIIRISLSEGQIYFCIRGKYTNVIFNPEGENISSFKKEEDSVLKNLIEEFNAFNYAATFSIPSLELAENTIEIALLRKKYSFIGKDIIVELERRTTETASSINILNAINEILVSIKQDKVAVFMDTQNEEAYIAPSLFKIYKSLDKTEFNSSIDALNHYLSKSYYLVNIQNKKKLITKHLEKELSRIANKLNNLSALIAQGSKADEYEKYANLILINLNRIPKNISTIEIEDVYRSNEPIEIKLDKKLSVQKNAGKYFKLAKNDKIKLEKAKEQYQDLQQVFERLKSIAEKIPDIDDNEKLFKLMKELKIKTAAFKGETKEKLENKFKQYLIDGKYKLFVGKDSRSNDLLTTKFARPNDYWFHARSVSGSHAVLKVENVKEEIPKNVLKKAAAVAAYHSKSRTSGLAPVSFTRKKYVVKKKGMEPGMAALLKEEVLLVKPEIPAGVEFVTND